MREIEYTKVGDHIKIGDKNCRVTEVFPFMVLAQYVNWYGRRETEGFSLGDLVSHGYEHKYPPNYERRQYD